MQWLLQTIEVSLIEAFEWGIGHKHTDFKQIEVFHTDGQPMLWDCYRVRWDYLLIFFINYCKCCLFVIHLNIVIWYVIRCIIDLFLQLWKKFCNILCMFYICGFSSLATWSYNDSAPVTPITLETNFIYFLYYRTTQKHITNLTNYTSIVSTSHIQCVTTQRRTPIHHICLIKSPCEDYNESNHAPIPPFK